MAAMLFKWLLLLHPFFVSVADFNFNAADKTLEISVRIFTDDFEKTLRKNNPGTKVDLLKPELKAAMDNLVKTYVPAHLKVNIDGKNAGLQYIGFEKIEESTWCYFEVPNIVAIKKLVIQNSILYDWQPKQSNMNMVHYGGKDQTKKVAHPDTEAVFGL